MTLKSTKTKIETKLAQMRITRRFNLVFTLGLLFITFAFRFKHVAHARTRKYLIVASIALSLVLMGGVSVVGLLQSTERVNLYGIVVQPPPPIVIPPPPPARAIPPPPASPRSPPSEPSIEVDVYADAGLTQVLSSVVWGEIEAGGSGVQVVYVHNSGDDGVTLSLLTKNWDPVVASDFLRLSWDYNGRVISSGEVRKITLVLSVSSSVSGINDFNFDIFIIGSAL